MIIQKKKKITIMEFTINFTGAAGNIVHIIDLEYISCSVPPSRGLPKVSNVCGFVI